MKKIFSVLFVLSSLLLGINTASAATSFEQAISQNKPMAVLIYADWADNAQEINTAYDAVAQSYASKFNFTKINICTSEAKGFNKTYHIYPNLPYVLLFKDKGKISRYLKKDCVMDNACFKERLDFFVN